MLEIKHISKTFFPGTADEKKALADFSLTVNDGDFISIIGANGAGKSTLFNAISGVFYIDEGTILLDGKDITYEKENIRSKKIGRLFQDPLSGTAPDMSILENLSLAAMKGGWMHRITAEERQEFREKLKSLNMGFEDRLDTPVRLLSGGQRQALTLLMATVNPPSLLLLDEHTAALDPASAEKIMELTDQVIRENHTTCLMITHNMNIAIQYGNRIIMMDEGRIVLDITKKDHPDLTMDDLLEQFKTARGKSLSTDRMLLGV